MKKLLSFILLTSLSVVSLYAQTYNEDVNSDGNVDISDVNAVIGVIVGNRTPTSDKRELADNWYVNIENPLVADYMNAVDYTPYTYDYSFSLVSNYSNKNAIYRKDQCQGVLIKWNNAGSDQTLILSQSSDFSEGNETISLEDKTTSVMLYNLYPQRTYYYRVISDKTIVKDSHFFTLGQVRMMHLNSMRNVRDLGGWMTDSGKRIKYGLIYRGGEINNNETLDSNVDHTISSEDSAYVHDKMNVRLDLDFRWNYELYLDDDDPTNDLTYTVLGKDVKYENVQIIYTYKYFISTFYSNNVAYVDAIRSILQTLESGHSVYMHCIWGADRTGILAMLIEGLCGVSESDICKDYELSSFYTQRTRTIEYFQKNLRYLKYYYSGTLKERFAKYLIRLGLTEDEITRFRNVLLE